MNLPVTLGLNSNFCLPILSALILFHLFFPTYLFFLLTSWGYFSVLGGQVGYCICSFLHKTLIKIEYILCTHKKITDL